MSASEEFDRLAAAAREAGLDTLPGAFAYGGGTDLTKPGLAARRRTRILLLDAPGAAHEVYLKRYGPEGLWARLRRRWTYGRRSSPAGVERRNLLACRKADVPTMHPVFFGEEFDPLGARRSYLLVTAVPGEALERCLEPFLRSDPTGERTARLTEALAGLVRRLHGCGFVHRDLYASHVFLDESPAGLRLYLIDLARMFAPRRRRFRWQVKDLAQLRYSMDARWVEDWWEEFFNAYAAGMGLWRYRRMKRAVERKVRAMCRRGRHRAGEGRK